MRICGIIIGDKIYDMIFDVEADGLLDEATKIHVLSYQTVDGIRSTHDYDEMRKIFLSAKTLIGHNIICYDVPLVERILGITIKAKLIDTLALSWYLNHTRNIHGLDAYGTEYKIPKPPIDDWKNLTPAEYRFRCEEDVKSTSRLWGQLKTKLLQIYDSKSDANKLIGYLSFKMDCLREQNRSRWKVDLERVNTVLPPLLAEQEEKVTELKSFMPPIEKWEDRTRPKKAFKKDGSYSVQGAKWFALLKEKGLPEDTESVNVLVCVEEPNPNSPAQVKDWLYSMGWEPESFDYKKNEDGSERKIPQVRVDKGEGKELCSSVTDLIPEYPQVAVLENLTLLQHRIGILTGFRNNEKDGYLVADAGGLTNTLRFKHRVLVNLPGVNKFYGKEIRGCLVAEEGYVLCGSDMSSLEENTKKHYMYVYDPEFVKEMSTPGFDAHLDLARHAKAVTTEEIDFYKQWKKHPEEVIEEWTRLDILRKQYKVANYACIYGVGAPKLARTTGLKTSTALALIEAYWGRNWAVKQLSEDTVIKHVGKEMWLYNPVSRFWYSLRYKKDTFSTLNQGTGVYCFDSWIREVRKVRKQLTGQFHDEIIAHIKKGYEERYRDLLLDAIARVNDKLKLNVVLGVDIKFGNNYAEIH